MDVSDIIGNEVGGCIFDRKTQQVYQVEVYAYPDNVAYRWIDPKWSLEYGIEAERRGVDKFNAYDDVEFTQVETEDDVLHLLTEMVHGTYVHSKPIKPEFTAGYRVDQTLNPVSAWPFPPMGAKKEETLSYTGPIPPGYDTDEYNNDEGMSGAMDDWKEDGDSGEGLDWDDLEETAEPKTEYEVVLTVKHRFTVKARNMEAAGDTAKRFQADMKSGSWEDGLCWEDRWVSKVAVAKRLETVNIED
jgi:hypothetical protein